MRLGRSSTAASETQLRPTAFAVLLGYVTVEVDACRRDKFTLGAVEGGAGVLGLEVALQRQRGEALLAAQLASERDLAVGQSPVPMKGSLLTSAIA